MNDAKKNFIPLRDTVLLRERTDIGPLVGHVPRFRLVGKPTKHVFFAEVVSTGIRCTVARSGMVVVLDAYDVSHSVPADLCGLPPRTDPGCGDGLLAPEKAMLAYFGDGPDPVPLWGYALTEFVRPEGGIARPDGFATDDVGISSVCERVLAVGPGEWGEDERGKPEWHAYDPEIVGQRLLFMQGRPDTPSLHWGGRRLTFVPWIAAKGATAVYA